MTQLGCIVGLQEARSYCAIAWHVAQYVTNVTVARCWKQWAREGIRDSCSGETTPKNDHLTLCHFHVYISPT